MFKSSFSISIETEEECKQHIKRSNTAGRAQGVGDLQIVEEKTATTNTTSTKTTTMLLKCFTSSKSRTTKTKRGESLPSDDEAIAKGGVACPFPWRVHHMLQAAEKEGLQDIVSWQPHGRAFLVRKPKEFVEKILPR